MVSSSAQDLRIEAATEKRTLPKSDDKLHSMAAFSSISLMPTPVSRTRSTASPASDRAVETMIWPPAGWQETFRLMRRLENAPLHAP